MNWCIWMLRWSIYLYWKNGTASILKKRMSPAFRNFPPKVINWHATWSKKDCIKWSLVKRTLTQHQTLTSFKEIVVGLVFRLLISCSSPNKLSREPDDSECDIRRACWIHIQGQFRHLKLKYDNWYNNLPSFFHYFELIPHL